MFKLNVPFEPLGGAGLSDEDIAAAEIDLGHRIPEAYRSFLHKMNGCYLTGAVFYRARSADAPNGYLTPVRCLMGIGHKLAGEDLVKWNRIGRPPPTGAFAFASDPYGNDFVVFSDGPRANQISFLDHESGDLTPLAASMVDFFGHLASREASEVLADFPLVPVVGHAVKRSTRKAQGSATKTSTKKAATKKPGAKKTSAKKTASKTTGKKRPAKGRR